MKDDQKKKTLKQTDLDRILEGTPLADAESLKVAVNDSVCVIHKGQMTALEVAEVIAALSTIASDLTVALTQACGLCDNCGERNPAVCPDCKGGAVCAELNGCKDGPAEWVRHCKLCQGLLDGSGDVRVPAYILEEAGIPKDAKLDVYANEDSGAITVVESDYQTDITDLPPDIVAILAKSGICLAELDELIAREEIVYGN